MLVWAIAVKPNRAKSENVKSLRMIKVV